ncbi:MAG TPA: hypothetical protein VFZ19_01765, partial [Solirubrobacterales bacterium]
MNQESRRVRNRFAAVVATLSATVLLLVLLPIASAAAASPWWQVLDGSRPSHLWVPKDNVQEVRAEGPLTGLTLEGSFVACIGSFCSAFGFPNSETAAQLQEALEAPAAYGPGNVEVVEDPESSRRFLITSVGEDAGRSVPPLAALGGGTAKVVTVGGSGRLILTVTNLGNAPVDGTSTPITIVDELPEGVIATNVEGYANFQGQAFPISCTVNATDLVTCQFEGTVPPYEALEIEVSVSVTGDPPAAGAPGTVTVSGGNAPSKVAAQVIEVSPEDTPFGIERFSAQVEKEGGEPATQAGAHPFQMTTTIQFNAGHYRPGGTRNQSSVDQPAIPRNLRFPLPAGLVGNATAVPYCEMTDFFERLPEGNCPAEA